MPPASPPELAPAPLGTHAGLARPAVGVMPEVCPSRGSTMLFVAFLHQAAVLKAAASHGLHPAACAGSVTVGVGIFCDHLGVRRVCLLLFLRYRGH